ncbi:MAG TPA: hypothetical protein VN541_19935 [Tepidisphaeraceae bacterium]|nr:hypothetical protein [Tepidisphaeraceae bacterium]
MAKNTKGESQNQAGKPVSQHKMPAGDDFAKIGPTSIEGVEASDLPDKGRGDVFTNPSKEAGRKLPQQTGQWGSGDTGLRGDPDIADSGEHGHRKHS